MIAPLTHPIGESHALTQGLGADLIDTERPPLALLDFKGARLGLEAAVGDPKEGKLEAESLKAEL